VGVRRDHGDSLRAIADFHMRGVLSPEAWIAVPMLQYCVPKTLVFATSFEGRENMRYS
jgi:hypothetical protein